MDTRQFYQSSGNLPNRAFNTPSPVVFPSASPTPKLYSTPTQKLPEVKSWQDIGMESVPQTNGNKYHDDATIIHHAEDYRHQNHTYNHFNDREKSSNTISPLSMMMESDTLLDDEDISSYRFSEEDYLSSILSSRPTSISSSPLRRRPVSFSSSSPQLYQLEEADKPIVGSPFAPVPNHDPIIERPRRFSLTGPVPQTSNSSVAQTSKLGSFMSRMKKAASTKPSLFK
ncbi:hypothetical protein MFLAVUS_000597 [Mucor flavus]|uniref:Uncharacterized protein n=1 Tax=Mucor flavus TaxID=439312 RepID=A0ABP9YK82_9FUNG